MGCYWRGYPSGLPGPVRRPEPPSSPEVVGVDDDREIPANKSIYIGEGARFLIVFSPADYVSELTDYSCDNASVSLSMEEGADNVLRVDVLDTMAPDTEVNIFFKGQKFMHILAVSPRLNFIDLGLPSGRLWADKNLGALSPTDSGKYFMWGEVKGHAKDSGFDFSLQNYKTLGLDVIASDLDLDHDAAHVLLGNGAKIPSEADFEELLGNTNYTIETIDGILCAKFVNRSNPSNYIVLPNVGVYEDFMLKYFGDTGYYISSTYKDEYDFIGLEIENNSLYTENFGRWSGYPIRAII